MSSDKIDMTVLIVDDEVANLESLQRIFEILRSPLTETPGYSQSMAMV